MGGKARFFSVSGRRSAKFTLRSPTPQEVKHYGQFNETVNAILTSGWPIALGRNSTVLFKLAHYPTVVSLGKSRDYDQAKEFAQAFIDNHPEAIDALTTLWLEADLFAQSYILGRKSRP
jgi:hypothetical protein